MAQSFTLLCHSTQANRTLRIGGTLVASNWAHDTTIYTVPSGKRLVVKGGKDTTVDNTDAVDIVSFQSESGKNTVTMVLGAGTKIQTHGGSSFWATGYLEDDV